METAGAKRKLHDNDDDDVMLTDENRGKESSQKDTYSIIYSRKPEKTDILEKYLDDIYKKHCKFSIGNSEIEFIRNGVEKLTLQYLQKTCRQSPCEDTSCKINHFCEIELVKAGSFYEGTRNGYPNEFDFIAVFGTVNEEPGGDTYSHLRTELRTECDIYQSDKFPDSSIRFGFASCSSYRGNAEKLEYLYKNDSEEITIDIDVVTALRCYNTEKYYTPNNIFNKEFYQQILKTGCFLFIFTGVCVSNAEYASLETSNPQVDMSQSNKIDIWNKTITETENRFVRDILSKKHRRVYRILKYIINGNIGEDLFKYMEDGPHLPHLPSVKGPSFCISSYNIKVAVIHHHYQCNKDSDEVGDCVLELLRYFLNLFEDSGTYIFMYSLYRNDGGLLIVTGTNSFIRNFYWCLRAFIDRLELLKTTDGFEKCTHDVENSFMEMALRLDIFSGYVHDLSKMSDIRPQLRRLIKKVKSYNEKRNGIPDCPWCDYPISIMAHKRKKDLNE